MFIISEVFGKAAERRLRPLIHAPQEFTLSEFFTAVNGCNPFHHICDVFDVANYSHKRMCFCAAA
jgi:hypothetical protein